eukprot:TRINITY_DN214_c0_g1_i4.p2 TRINITY_DN214_c0_g1~~TRINITY_DN214_c0_g1_i4.p2  ORF type:complete len:437 (-),score=108.13 TRINITY_DN214_c0_g1_i4:148-1302(-)
MAPATRCRRACRRAVALVAAAIAAATLVGSASAALPLLRDGSGGDYVWTPIDSITDEWLAFDAAKWRDTNPRWFGRAPSAFKAENVRVKNGRLLLRSRRDTKYEYPSNPPGMPAEPRLYGNWTTSFVESRTLAAYGFFQTKARPGNSPISSSFWASWNTPTDWTEIDIFELGGGALGGPGPGFPFIMFMNMHVFRRTGTSFTPATVFSQPGNYVYTEPLANRFHTYAVDWDEAAIVWYFNGRPVRSAQNVYHQQPLAFKFDSETMPNWFGLPDETFKSVNFRINYIRAWSREDVVASARTARARTREDVVASSRMGRGRSPSRVFPATGQAAISPYALQRAPMPNSPQVAGLAEPVPRGGWSSLPSKAVGPVARSIGYFGPVVV